MLNQLGLPTLIHKLSNKLRKQLTSIQRANRFVWQATPRWTVVNIALVLLQGLLPLGVLYLTKLIVDQLSVGMTTQPPDRIWVQLLPLLLISGGITLMITASQVVADLVRTAQGEKVTDHMQGVLYAKAIEVDLEHYESSRYYDILERARQEAPYRPTQILAHLTQFGQSSVSLLAMVGLLLSLHWGIAGILFVSAIPAMMVRVRYANRLYQWDRQNTALERQAYYRGWLLSNGRNAKEVRLFNLGHYFLQQFHTIRQKIYRDRLSIAVRWSIESLLAKGMASVFVFAVYGFIVYQTVHGVMRLGDLVLCHQALRRGQDALNGVISNMTALYEDNLFLQNLSEFLELQPRVVEPIVPQPMPTPMRSGIVFKNVDFQYGETSRKALRQINLRIKPGETIALVGENGSGKTTLIKLLCRLYDPTSGCITVDGVDLKKVSVVDLRRQISVIFQDYAKYYLTAQDNIRLGNLESEPDSSQITQAAHHSGAHEVIQTLPQQYDTVLGKWFENGEELSIGQWQKIALARAFVRDSQLIILDEPSSAMDPKAESELFQHFRRLIKDQAAVLISHRLSTVKMADYIYVMEHGKIVEHGKHADLIELGGTYAHLFETQAQHYR
ncbi:MAG: ABC transporter ATP-binding protein [Cyanobacteria bacterium P01_F01_bin.150]